MFVLARVYGTLLGIKMGLAKTEADYKLWDAERKAKRLSRAILNQKGQ